MKKEQRTLTPARAVELLDGDKSIWRELGYKSIQEFNKDWDIAWNMAIQALKDAEKIYDQGFKDGIRYAISHTELD